MGIRFRKTLKIAPGVKVNISKSGPSLTLGPQGFTTTVGKQGVYQNIGLPGSGLSARFKVFGFSGSSKKSGGTSSAGDSKQPSLPAAVKEWMAYTGESNPQATVDMDFDGTIVIADGEGKVITDPQLIGIIKRTPTYRNQLPEVKEQHRLEVAEKVKELNDLNEALIKMHRQSPEVLSLAAYQHELDVVRAKNSTEDIEKQILLERAIKGGTEFIELAVEKWIKSCDIPLEIFMQYEYDDASHCLMVDLDLPEIEDLPTTMATQLASGHLKLRDKSQKLLREEYAECVFSLAIYLSANLFNISPSIEQVVVSGYTQRRNSAGDIKDDYLFSIKFVREAFYGVDYQAIDAETFCMQFDNRCNLSATKIFKTIVPY